MQTVDWYLDQIFHEDFSELFPNLKVLVSRIEEVLYLLLIDLVEWDMNFPV